MAIISELTPLIFTVDPSNPSIYTSNIAPNPISSAMVWVGTQLKIQGADYTISTDAFGRYTIFTFGALPGSIPTGIGGNNSVAYVSSFGAVGDGATNDTTAIQNAINSGAPELIFEQGRTYKITDELTIATPIKIDFRNATLKAGVLKNRMVNITCNNVTLCNGTLDMNGFVKNGIDANGGVGGLSNLWLTDLNIQNQYASASNLDGGLYLTAFNNVYINGGIYTNINNAGISGSTDHSPALKFISCSYIWINNTEINDAGVGINCYDTEHLFASGVKMEGINNNGYYIQYKSTDIDISGGYVRNFKDAGVTFKIDSKYSASKYDTSVRVRGVEFSNTEDYLADHPSDVMSGIVLRTGSGLLVSDCVFLNCGTAMSQTDNFAGCSYVDFHDNIIISPRRSSAISVEDGDNIDIHHNKISYITGPFVALRSLTVSGTTATATTVAPHNLSLNDEVTISGAVETGYNTARTKIDVTSATTFTYTVTSGLPTPATGLIFATCLLTVGPKSTVFSLTCSGMTATLVTSQPHNLITNDTVIISGAAESGYNTAGATITRINDTTFTYGVPSGTPTSATGNIKVSYTCAVSGITRSGTTATATTSVGNSLSTDDLVTITGALPVEYNETTVITVVNTTDFTYGVDDTLTTPATTLTSIKVTRLIVSEPAYFDLSLSVVGALATATLGVSDLATGDIVCIQGASETRYNTLGSSITVTESTGSSTKFTYIVPSGISTTATGTATRINTAMPKLLLTSLTSSGGSTTATAVTNGPHNLTTGKMVSISGASISGYNLNVSITKVNATTFTYSIASGLSDPTGVIIVTLPVQSYVLRFNNVTNSTITDNKIYGNNNITTAFSINKSSYITIKNNIVNGVTQAFQNVSGTSTKIIRDQVIALKDFYTDGSSSGTSAVDVYSYTIPENQLQYNGDKIIAEYEGTFAVNATANDRIYIYFNTAIFDTGTFSRTTVGSWNIKVVIIRVDSSTIRASTTLISTGSNPANTTVYATLSSIDFTATNVLKIKFAATTAANDIVAKMGSVSFLPAAV
nr:hypothetical protein [uncultured Mucilaginibacter sp.]